MSAKLRVTRGDTLRYNFTLSSTWTGASFTGGVLWTVRAAKPASTVLDDTDAFYQASVVGGQITFVGGVGTLLVPAAITTTWPVRTYLWDLQGIVDGTVPTVYTIDYGEITITYDITRNQTIPTPAT